MKTTNKRPGRPAKPNMVAMSIKVDKQLADLIRAQSDKYSVTIEKALWNYFYHAKQDNSTEHKQQSGGGVRYF